jgi:TPR repeat protein
MKNIFFIFTLLASMTTHSELSEGGAAFARGDYKTAIFILKQVLQSDQHSNWEKHQLNRKIGNAYYYAADDIDSDFKLFFRSVIKSGDANMPAREYLLGRHYFYGRGDDLDYHLSKYHLEKAGNNRGALLILGRQNLLF